MSKKDLMDFVIQNFAIEGIKITKEDLMSNKYHPTNDAPEHYGMSEKSKKKEKKNAKGKDKR